MKKAIDADVDDIEALGKSIVNFFIDNKEDMTHQDRKHDWINQFEFIFDNKV